MIYLKNEKGLNAELSMHALVTEHGLKHLASCVASHNASPELARFVELASTLPSHAALGLAVKDTPGVHNFGTPPTPHGMCYSPTRGILVAAGFKISVPDTRANKMLTCTPTPEGLGWAQVPELVSITRRVQQEAAALGVHLALDGLEKANRTLSRKNWTLVEVGSKQMQGAQCCVIYRTQSDGFVDHKSETVGLSHARLFETQIEAQNMIDRAKMKDAVIARVSVKLEGLAPNQALPPNLGMLQSALDEVQAEQQAQALESHTPHQPATTAPRRRF